MLKKLKLLAACAALALISVSASATPWSQTINLNPDRYISSQNPFTWTHDLTTAGFLPGIDTISGFTLSLQMYDDSRSDSAEYAFADLPGLFDDQTWEVNSGWYSTGGNSLIGLFSLSQTGALSVTLSSTSPNWWTNAGDFYLDSSTLTAWGRDGNRVPEPGSLALLGLGLAGLAIARRDRKSVV